MKKTILFISSLFLAIAAQSEPLSHCDKLVAFGYPVSSSTSNTTPLCRIAYFVSHDNAHKIPLYSAEYLLKENLGGKIKRVNAFKADPDLDANTRSELSDYDGSNYDRGHMTPFEDTRTNSAAALQTFYLSNMIPQEKHLNRGMWRAIENKTRQYALESTNGVFVITGPVFTNTVHKIIGSGIQVPDMVFKVVIDRSTMQGIAFLVPNTGPKTGDTMGKFVVSIRTVEQITGINFTPDLSDDHFKDHIGQQFQ